MGWSVLPATCCVCTPACGLGASLGFNSNTISSAPTKNATKQKITMSNMFGPEPVAGALSGIFGAASGPILTCGICGGGGGGGACGICMGGICMDGICIPAPGGAAAGGA